MPCTDGGPIRSVSDYEYNRVKQRLDKVTRLLCTVMKDHDSTESHEAFFMAICMDKELQEWWKEHQKMDKEREKAEKEALVASAKSKLTKKELKAILDANK